MNHTLTWTTLVTAVTYTSTCIESLDMWEKSDCTTSCDPTKTGTWTIGCPPRPTQSSCSTNGSFLRSILWSTQTMPNYSPRVMDTILITTLQTIQELPGWTVSLIVITFCWAGRHTWSTSTCTTTCPITRKSHSFLIKHSNNAITR